MIEVEIRPREPAAGELADILDFYGVSAAHSHKLYEELTGAYSEDGRFYHTLAHVGSVLDVLAALGPWVTRPASVRLAAWFHDAVYDPRADDNEARSAALAAERLEALGLPAGVWSEVGRLIRLTQGHDPGPDDPDGEALVDADLAILGAAPAVYARYADDIRREYAWVPDERYRAGRAQVLARFLAREHIFHTADMRAWFEARARSNLEREIRELQ